MKGSIKNLNKNLQVPFILHIRFMENNVSCEHFIVVKKIGKKYIVIFDPDPLKKVYKLAYDELEKVWTGYAIFLEPDTDFKKSDKKENLLLKFISVFLLHKKILIYSFLSSILLLALGITTSFYYKYIFDEVVYSKASFSLHTLSSGLLLVTVIQSIVACVRSVLLSHFSFKTDLLK